MRFGWMEILLIVGLVLLIFGPKRFGLVGRSAREGMNELKQETQKEDPGSDSSRDSEE